MKTPNRPGLIALVGLALLAGWLVFLKPAHGHRTVTAEFSRAVSVYVGTDVRVLGVTISMVTRITPAGDVVRVEMEDDDDVTLPANPKAVVVTPTLVADRFVQITPAYSGGDALASGAVIALPDTGVPVELDRIYASLKDLSVALGPNGVNKDGTLDNLLGTAATTLDGKGKLANETLTELAAAVHAFGEGSGDLFATVSELAKFTETLAGNDAVVRSFITDLAGVSVQLAGERAQIQRAVAAVARAVGTVRVFVHRNRTALVRTVRQLTRVTGTIASEKSSIDAALTAGPLAIGNLALAFNSKTGTIGSRISIKNNIADTDGFLCAVVQQSTLPKASRDLACRIFELIEPIEQAVASDRPASGPAPSPSSTQPSTQPSTQSTIPTTPTADPTSQPTDGTSLESLMGGGQ